MRFQCLDVTCGKAFGWTAKKTIYTYKTTNVNGPAEPLLSQTEEFIVCPYCGSLDFEEVNGTLQKKKKTTPPMKPLAPATKSLQFDPADLMEHQGWKNRKQGDNNYTAGSLNWGWDFEDKFKPETIELLKKGTQTIGGYEFSYNSQYKSVKVKKAKQ